MFPGVSPTSPSWGRLWGPTLAEQASHWYPLLPGGPAEPWRAPSLSRPEPTAGRHLSCRASRGLLTELPAAPRGTHLWEFIRDILIQPELNEGLLKWEDRRQGVFKFLRSEAVAQLWGQKKKNSSMTYEKLSRAMR